MPTSRFVFMPLPNGTAVFTPYFDYIRTLPVKVVRHGKTSVQDDEFDCFVGRAYEDFSWTGDVYAPVFAEV